MGAFIIAGLVFVGTLVLCAFMAFAAGMSTTGNSDVPVGATFITGTVIAALIAGSHWMPHIGW